MCFGIGEYPQFKRFLAFVILVYMTIKRCVRIVPTLFIFLIFGITTKEAEARHTAYQGYSSAIQKKINALVIKKSRNFISQSCLTFRLKTLPQTLVTLATAAHELMRD